MIPLSLASQEDGDPEKPDRACRAQRKGPPRRKNKLLLFLLSCAGVLLLCLLLPSLFGGHENVRIMSGLKFHLPEHYVQRYSDSRYAVWEYAGKDLRPGNLILDADIRDGKGRNFSTAEEVLAECDWMTDMELYVNPQGVRMVRGFADYSGSPERRYYIETSGSALLMCMLEDERFYSPIDCETVMLQTADSVHPVK